MYHHYGLSKVFVMSNKTERKTQIYIKIKLSTKNTQRKYEYIKVSILCNNVLFI